MYEKNCKRQKNNKYAVVVEIADLADTARKCCVICSTHGLLSRQPDTNVQYEELVCDKRDDCVRLMNIWRLTKMTAMAMSYPIFINH